MIGGTAKVCRQAKLLGVTWSQPRFYGENMCMFQEDAK